MEIDNNNYYYDVTNNNSNNSKKIPPRPHTADGNRRANDINNNNKITIKYPDYMSPICYDGSPTDNIIKKSRYLSHITTNITI